MNLSSLNPFKKKVLKEETSAVDYGERAKKTYNITEYNPSKLANKRGRLGIYKDMEKDDCLARVHEFKAKSVTSIDWDIVPGEETPLAKEQADFTKDVLNKTTIPTKDCMQNLLDKSKYGFKVAELKWGVRDLKVVIENIKCKPSEMFDFDTDEYDNLKPDGLILTNSNRTRLNVNKFVIIVHPYLKDGNWYGTSDYDAVYREWWSKDVMIKMRNKAAESYAEPLRDVIYDKTKMSTTELNAMKAIINDLHSNLAIYRPATWDKEGKNWIPTSEVKYLETQRKTSEEYTMVIEKLDTAMTRRALIGDHLGQTKTENGSRASSQSDMELFWLVLKEIIQQLQDVYNEQVIKRLIDANWTGTKVYPRMKFHTISDDITKEKMDIMKLAIDMGIVDGEEEWVRPYLNLPKLTPEAKAKMDEKKAQAEAAKQQALDNMNNGGGKGKNQDQQDDEGAGLKHRHLKKQKFEDYTNYKAIETAMDATEKDVIPELSKAFEDIRQDLIWQAQKIVNSGKVKYEIDIKAKHKGAIRNILELAFMDTMMKGKESAINEIEKAQKKTNYKINIKPELRNYKDIKIQLVGGNIDFITKTYADKFSYADKYLKDKQKQRAFYITGVESSAILGKVNKILTEGIGKLDVAKITAQIDEVFNPYLETGEIDGRVGAPERLNTIVRTNTTRVMNEARLSTYEDPDLNNFVKAFAYSAILDDRTTDFCAFHDGQVVRAGDPRLYVLAPSHFNCRSLWTAIFAGEDFETDWYDKAGIEPGQGFGLAA